MRRREQSHAVFAIARVIKLACASVLKKLPRKPPNWTVTEQSYGRWDDGAASQKPS
jgi:hypothetical protein